MNVAGEGVGLRGVGHRERGADSEGVGEGVYDLTGVRGRGEAAGDGSGYAGGEGGTQALAASGLSCSASDSKVLGK